MSDAEIQACCLNERDARFQYSVKISEIEGSPALPDCKFPPLAIIKSRMPIRFVARIKQKNDECDVTLEEESFLEFRDALAPALKKGQVAADSAQGSNQYQISDEFKKKYQLVLENEELSKLYEELVINSQTFTHEEFFSNHSSFAGSQKIKRFNEQELPRDSQFFVTKRAFNENKEERIEMRFEDKVKLLEQFPELRDRFQKLHLEKFNDRHEEEAKFWDEFWQLQKERKTLLYGGETKESKDIMKNLPVFSHKDAEPNLATEQDGLDLLNFREKEDELYEKYAFKGKNQEGYEYIAEMLNNHSIMIKSKESDLKTRLDFANKETRLDSDFRRSALEEREAVVTSAKKKQHGQQASEEEKFRSRYNAQQKQEIADLWKDFVRDRKARVESNPG